MSTDKTKTRKTLLSAIALMAGISGAQQSIAATDSEESASEKSTIEFNGALPLHVYNDNDVDDDNRYFEITANENTAFEFEIETTLMNQNNKQQENHNVAFDINLYDEQGFSVLNYTLDLDNETPDNSPSLEDVYREKNIDAGTYLMSIALNYGSEEGLQNQSNIRFSLNGSVEEIS
jgi:hypothetical protein